MLKGEIIKRGDGNKEQFDALLARIECSYKYERESLASDGTYSVIYVMRNGGMWVLVLDDDENPVSLQELR